VSCVLTDGSTSFPDDQADDQEVLFWPISTERTLETGRGIDREEVS
jgi:hypothetical protein